MAEEKSEAAHGRMEDLICLNSACLAALTHLPVQSISGAEGKNKVNYRVHLVPILVSKQYL